MVKQKHINDSKTKHQRGFKRKLVSKFQKCLNFMSTVRFEEELNDFELKMSQEFQDKNDIYT